MAPSSTMLDGLNVIQPQFSSSLSDSQDLLSSPPFDLSAQLDLWTNVNFASDEPLSASPDSGLPDNAPFDAPKSALSPAPTAAHTTSSIDLNSAAPHSNLEFDPFLPGLPVDPFQLGNFNYHYAGPLPSLDSVFPFSYHQPHLGSSALPPSPVAPSPTATAAAPPPAKKARTTRKSSTATATSAKTPSTPTEANDEDEGDGDESLTGGIDKSGNPITAAEDKRRRNTAASARFRLKKKEREQAMEKKAKELEAKVSELERECEGLRRENVWLKGIVIATTGGSIIPPTSGSDAASTLLGAKRSREEEASDDNKLLGAL